MSVDTERDKPYVLGKRALKGRPITAFLTCSWDGVFKSTRPEIALLREARRELGPGARGTTATRPQIRCGVGPALGHVA